LILAGIISEAIILNHNKHKSSHELKKNLMPSVYNITSHLKASLVLCWLFAAIVSPAQQSADCQVKKITLYTNILKRGGNPAYKPSGDSIVYQKNVLNLSNFVLSTQVFISDTAINNVRCLTCDTNFLPAAIRHDKHKGNAEYHPNGNYILFTSENENGAHQPWNLPGAGVDNDIFIRNISGSQYWRLTNIPAGHGILHPAFSHDGTKLFWAEMYYSTPFPPQGQEYGLWTMKMADFSFSSGNPQISNIVSFAPRDSVWYETHSFSPDDRFISFTSHEEDSSAYFGDITIMDTADIGTGNFINLTNTPNIHDEHSHWSPDGNKISWMSGIFIGGLETYISELYLMDANGANQTRLTHFTDPTYPEYIQDSVVTPDHYWSPDGKRIFGFVHFINGSGWQSELYQLEFMGPCGLAPAGIQAATNKKAFDIYPNPANDKLNFTFSDVNAVMQVEIYNVFGQVVLVDEVGMQENTIDISALTAGIYFVRANGKDDVIYQEKIVVAK
jgi:Tol biopolymer transport system component